MNGPAVNRSFETGIFDKELELTASSSKSAATYNYAKELGESQNQEAHIVVVVTTVGSSATLDLTAQHSDTNGSYADLVKLPQITAVGKYFLPLPNNCKKWTNLKAVVGTAAITFQAYITAKV